jgi:hypothetical protein
LTAGSVQFRGDVAKGNNSMRIPVGSIDDQGHYEIFTNYKRGAPRGWYKVVVIARDERVPAGLLGRSDVSPATPMSLIDEKFADPEQTSLGFEVVPNSPPGAYDLTVSR